jgi:N-acetylglutamate synthase-like GNAT family acetyltransferase
MGRAVSIHIRRATHDDVDVLTDIIRRAFRDVADRFAITPENGPTHPSNCEGAWIESDLSRGVSYFLLIAEGLPCGCVAVEIASPEVCYLERLAVVPERRNEGFGRRLVNRALREGKEAGVTTMSVGIIAKHSEVRDWYGRLGFAEDGERSFDHLPFEVAFLRYDLVTSPRRGTP